MEVIKHMLNNCTMLELGAYWAFYSLSLLEERPDAQCFLVEPSVFNLESGRMNFRLNNRKGRFYRALDSDHPIDRPRTISVDYFCAENHIKHLNILHADIQRLEFAMLHGAKEMLSNGRIDYVFISTHSTRLHDDCRKILEAHNYSISHQPIWTKHIPSTA